MDDLIQISVPFHKTMKSKQTIVDVPQKPGSSFSMQKLLFETIPVDEVQTWIDDGRIKHFEYSNQWLMGQQRVAHFFFDDPKAAMLFKLTYS
jgi:hypothetical protein